ncbi:MAG: hypothetical protein OXG64_06720 [Chloroflexi bacterium]|nr:hypothetical protein [Chloroflexota bacterium]
MSAPESMRTRDAMGARVRRLVEALARRVQARRLASEAGVWPDAWGKVLDSAPGAPEPPTAWRGDRAGQRALLRQLLAAVGGRARTGSPEKETGSHGPG